MVPKYSTFPPEAFYTISEPGGESQLVNADATVLISVELCPFVANLNLVKNTFS